MKNKADNAYSLMPLASEEKALLESRKLDLVESNNQPGIQLETPYLEFSLGARSIFGIAYNHLDEVLLTETITSIPKTPDFITGTISRRGKLITVICLDTLFGLNVSNTNAECPVIILRKSEIQIGLKVREIIGYKKMLKERLTKTINGVQRKNYISGIWQNNVSILNTDELFTDQEIIVTS